MILGLFRSGIFVVLLIIFGCLVVESNAGEAVAQPAPTCAPSLTTTPPPAVPDLLKPANGAVGIRPIPMRLRLAFWNNNAPILLVADSGKAIVLQGLPDRPATPREIDFSVPALSPNTLYSVFQEYVDEDPANPPVCSTLHLDKIGTFRTSQQ
jgi:hypothetical protein